MLIYNRQAYVCIRHSICKQFHKSRFLSLTSKPQPQPFFIQTTNSTLPKKHPNRPLNPMTSKPLTQPSGRQDRYVLSKRFFRSNRLSGTDGKMPEKPYFQHFWLPYVSLRDINTTVSTWHEEMILLAHTSYLFAQSRIGTYPPFWALGRSPMQEHIDKLELSITDISPYALTVGSTFFACVYRKRLPTARQTSSSILPVSPRSRCISYASHRSARS